MFENVLVPLDGTYFAERALPYAVALARAGHGRLVLQRTTPAVEPTRAATNLNALATRIRSTGLVVETVVVRVPEKVTDAEIARIIETTATAQGVQVVAMATHASGNFDRWLEGSVADQMVRQAALPVLAVGPRCFHPWLADRVERILVPIDESDVSLAAVGPARELATVWNAGLDILHVDLLPRSMDQRDAARSRYQPAVDEARADGLAVQLLFDSGHPAATIATVAREQQADLIVMATHARTGLARWTKGSTAVDTLEDVGVPILLIRTDRFAG